ncbi:hypothetical protein [Ralstonia sp.]
MSLQKSRRIGIHATALGGFTIDGPYYQRRRSLAVLVERFFHFLGA